ncbi:MAG: 30S ribosomal protein S12 methylthiotransferase RimO [Proteobacteria bacterium]|nr:30S ribosomal protein S12 methylthiotransferase RimO [Pseudomonadota bacterium]
MVPKGVKTIHFISLGCPKNRVDTEVMAGIAQERGLEIVSESIDADIIVVNTCAFVESAREESVDTLLEMELCRTQGRLKRLVSAGCLTQRFGEELAREMPEIDYLLGTEQLDRFDQVIDGTASKITVGPPAHFLQKPSTPRFIEPGTPSAYIKISDGCSRKCAFCAIPGIRGTGRSRPIYDIVAEAERLVLSGVKELNLVSQDTSAYGRDLGDGTDITGLIRALDQDVDIAWIRLLYLYPDTAMGKLFKTMCGLPKVVPYLDIPIQHASAKMLRRMRRGHGPGRLEQLIKNVRKTIPNAFLRTTVLVGHPGETDDDLAELLDFLEWARFDHLGVFRYSEEDGTRSSGTGPVVPARLSYNRLRKVMALGRRISKEKNRARIGKLLEVLIENVEDEKGYVLKGRHAGQAPEVDGVTYVTSSSASVGDITEARVTKTGDYDLVVEPV